jgi:hypothetical protein
MRWNEFMSHIKIHNLRKYLDEKGWVEVPINREEVLKFRSPQPLYENKYMEIFIPKEEFREDLVDYNRVIEIAIEVISSYEKRDFEDTLSEILTFDILDTDVKKIIKDEIVEGINRAKERILKIDKNYPNQYIFKIMILVIRETLGVNKNDLLY